MLRPLSPSAPRARVAMPAIVALVAVQACAPSAPPAAPPSPVPDTVAVAPPAPPRDTVAPVVVEPPAPEPAPEPRREAPRERVPLARIPVAPGTAVRVPSSPVRAPEREPGEIRVCAGGDVTLGTNLPAGGAGRSRATPVIPSPDSLLDPLRPLLVDADIVVLNVEAAIGDGPSPSKCGPNSTACYAMRSPASAAGALRRVAPHATVVGNVANNHSGDAGMAGYRRTLELLEGADVRVTGADSLPTLAVSGGDTVAVLGFSTSPRGPDARDLAAVRRHVSRAAERHGRVVVTVHMGAEGAAAQRTPDSVERYYGENRGNPVAFARAAVEAGARLVVGHGPHVLRGMEWHDGALVAYSLGNLVTYGPFNNREPLNRGAVLCATLGPQGEVYDALVHPTRQIRAGIMTFDPSGRALFLVDSLSRLDFPRSAARVAGEGWLGTGR